MKILCDGLTNNNLFSEGGWGLGDSSIILFICSSTGVVE